MSTFDNKIDFVMSMETNNMIKFSNSIIDLPDSGLLRGSRKFYNKSSDHMKIVHIIPQTDILPGQSTLSGTLVTYSKNSL